MLLLHQQSRKDQPAAENEMSRNEYLEQYTIRQLRIYARKQNIVILQKWTKPELIAAIIKSGK
jgi:hypothetical protein